METDALSKVFGGFSAVKDVTLRVRCNTVHALIGPNGAGKTTLFNLLTKFLEPSSGTIRFDGRDITGTSPAVVARLGIVRSFQISAVFSSMTALENVKVALQRRRGESFDFWRSRAVLRYDDARAMEILHEVGLADSAGTLAAELPYGRKRALELATTMALDPKLLLLDEPMAGMAHEEIDRIVELIRALAVSRTILMVEHNLGVVASLSDEITVLARGETLAHGDYAAISADPTVQEAYLGV